jgi:hypothetical protein
VYKPSAELLSALGSLPEGLVELDLPVKAEEREESVKLEPTDEVTLSDYKPSADLLLALATLPDDANFKFTGEMMESKSIKRCIQGVGHETRNVLFILTLSDY